MKTKLIIEPHIHGAFGIDFNKATVQEMLYVSENLLKYGIGGFYPTLVTDSVENLKRQIAVIKDASTLLKENTATILGVHLEGNFINEAKKGIHNPEHFLELTAENYKLLEDDFIKIVTLAPELDIDLIDYLNKTGVKVQAGHCTGGDLSKCSGVTHVFNAMKGITHRERSTALSALNEDNIFIEVIADGTHLSDEMVRFIFKVKPLNKIILISDALPITYSDLKETVFADSVICYDGVKATSKDGTIAGSTTLIPQIIQRLIKMDLFTIQFINNTYNYLGLNIEGELQWSDDGEIVLIKKGNNIIYEK